MNKRRFFSKLNALVLVSAICVQTIGAPLMVEATTSVSDVSTTTANQKVFGQTNGVYDAVKDQEVITLEVNNLRSDIRIEYIMLPNGSKVEGELATYTAEYNGDFSFNVVYEEIKTITNESGDEVEYILNGQQTFKHTVSSILSGSEASTDREVYAEDYNLAEDFDFEGVEYDDEDIEYTRMTGREYKSMAASSGAAEYYTALMEV